LVLEKKTRKAPWHHVGRRAAVTAYWQVKLAAMEAADKGKEEKPEVDFVFSSLHELQQQIHRMDIRLRLWVALLEA